MGWLDGATTGDWKEFLAAQIETCIAKLSRNSHIEPARELVARIAKQFESDKSKSPPFLVWSFPVF